MSNVTKTTTFRPAVHKLLLILLAAFVALGALFFYQYILVRASDPPLSVEILTAYNLVVDSNVSSPSTYAPSAATVGVKFCNTSGTDTLNNVWGYIGDYTGSGALGGTPGVYPSRDTTDPGFLSAHPVLDTAATYQFVHIGGADDPGRFIGDLAPGQCSVQYWHFSYPQCEANDAPPCNGGMDPVWGAPTNPADDLYLFFDAWATADVSSGGSTTTDASRKLTMRNEISAMANKIEPNPNGAWFNTDTNTVDVGDVITSNGVNYTFGNVNKGFDNDGDGLYDNNAWVQPIGDASYDPSCFRLIRTSGVLTVTRSGGNPPMILNFTDQLYFENLPSDNTNVTGRLYYTFQALDGACTVSLSPYQEAASGSDNEKFNADFGAGVPPVVSLTPQVTVSKTGPNTVAENTTFTYNIPFQNDNPNASLGLTLTTGGSNTPLVVEDSVPDGLRYVCGSASVGSFTYSASNPAYYVRFSKDSGSTWSATAYDATTLASLEDALWVECADADSTTHPASTGPDSLIVIQWWLADPLPAKSGDPAPGATATFDAFISSTYISGGGSPIIDNCAEFSIGGANPFDEACKTTLVLGSNSIGDLVWQDDDLDGIKDSSESGLDNVTVSLYYDKNGDGKLDSGDILITSTSTSGGGAYSFGSLPDGQYLVQVDASDPQLPTGYTLTTPSVFAVSLDPTNATTTPVNYVNADFGFAPVLSLTKMLSSSTPVPLYEGRLVTFDITLKNNLPGNGTGQPSTCQRTSTIWSNNGGILNGTWINPSNAFQSAEPDALYATSSFAGNTDILGSQVINPASIEGAITKVEAIYWLYQTGTLQVGGSQPDAVYSIIYDAAGTTVRLNTQLDNAYMNANFSSASILPVDVTSVEATWEWSDFTNLRVAFRTAKNGGADEATIYMGAMGWRITVNATCGGSQGTIVTLPLTDTYDSDLLWFISADPTHSITTTTGLEPNDSLVKWDNVGPLYAGQTKIVKVTFLAKEPPDGDSDGEADPADTTNFAEAKWARFGNGRLVNYASDSENVTINPAGKISGTVWNNLVPDNIIDANGADNVLGNADDEKGIAGVTVQLYQCVNGCDDAPGGDDVLVETTITDANGFYQFQGLADGTYQTRVVTSSLPNGGTNVTNNYDLDNGTVSPDNDSGALVINNNDGSSANDNVTPVNFGYNMPAMITGTIWHDLNRDGDSAPDSGEQGLSGVIVVAYDGTCEYPDTNGSTADDCKTGTTDVNGRYTITGLSPAGGGTTYQVTVYTPSPAGDPLNGGSWTQSFDTDGTGSAHVVAVTLVPGTLGVADYSYYKTGASDIGDFLFQDWDGDGVIDPSEEGIPNVTIWLYEDSDGDGTIDEGVDALIATDVTDANGGYLFENLPAGNYIVVVNENDPDLPGSYNQTKDPDESGICTICDGMSTVTTDGAENSLDEDFGYRITGTGSIGDFIWIDSDGDGIQDANESGVAGVTVKLYHDEDGDGVIDSGDDALLGSATTLGYAVINGYIDVDGNASTPPDANDDLTSLYGVKVIDGALDIDGDGSITANDDGTFAGYTVIDGRLDMNADGNASDSDDGDLVGLYQFTDLPAGDYIIQVGSENFASGQPLYRLKNSSGTQDDLHAVSLSDAQEYRDADLGYTNSSIGGYIWQDNDGQGDLDDNEPAISGVKVTLYIDNDGDGKVSAGDTVYDYDGDGSAGSAGDTITSGVDGLYEFTGLPAGDYVVKIEDSNFDPGGALENFNLTYDPDAYSTDPIDYPYPPCDPADTTHYKDCDNQSAADDLALGQVDRSHYYGYQPLGVIGDTLWIDADGNGQYDAGEALLSGVTVYLCTTMPCNDASETMSVTTNVDGFYSFGGLNVNSTYYVAVDNSDVPSYLAQTYEPNNNGAGDDNSAVDNTVAVYINASGAVSSINGVACTDCNLDVDYGYRLTDGTNSVSGTIFFDSNQNGGIYNNGGGALDYPLQDVTVSLWMLDCGADSTCGTADDGPSTLVTATQTTTAGAYSFSNLPNGDYRIVVDTPSAQLSDMTQTSEPDDSLCTDAGSNCNNLHILELSGNQTIEDKDWGFYAEMDCGDLPASYNRTILADEGPCHILGNIQLGANWDAETNGFITDSIAQGDDVNQPTSVDDEDGISFLNPSTWTAGGAGTIRISSVVGDNAYLVGWFDWNRDNDFFDASTGKWDAGEYIYFGHIPAGNNIDKSVPIPSSASLPNSINMRFRLYEGASPPPLISPGGVVQNGEVEDYQEPLGPTAVTMGQYGAISGVGQVTIYWETALELDAIGFNLFRATDPDGERVQLNPELIPSQAFGGLMGAYYEFIDYDVQAGQTYYYWLEFIDFEGKTVFGPMAGYGGYGIYLPLVTR